MRPELPTGTVTFLFTDVEGSTKLLHALGAERYAEALAEHRRVIREACRGEGGIEVDTQGDAFFFAFASAPGAAAAAAAFTEALASGQVQVRVGLHTGTPVLAEEGYVGADVHLAARVASSAHGGQVVLSRATRELCGSEPQGVPLVDLGEHRLKDVSEPISIFQLGEHSFPPLKTISNTNLPRPASSFLGREAELADVVSRIQAGARLLTLTGPGGTGKTRLALEAASSLVPAYKAGVFWVGLASLRDPALVHEQISQMLGAKDGLAEHIGERELLLLLDNLEQVVEAAPELASLLERCPYLTLLCTSRELLRVRGEVEYRVPPLASSEAVALFCERAQLEPTEEIAELCARLDSLPLALELAAARTKALTPGQILERLSSRLDLLKGGRDAESRHETLRATIAWSYELLTPEEQQLFARLAVFRGGYTLEAADEVADASLDTLQSLLEKSLLRFAPSESGGRYWMLETIRDYAGERLVASRDYDDVRQLHARFFLSLTASAEPHLRVRPRDWLDRLEREHDNLRAALEQLEASGEAEHELEMVSRLWRLWYQRGYPQEGRQRIERALAADERPTAARAMALDGAAALALQLGDVPHAKRRSREALELYRRQGDATGVAGSLLSLGFAAVEEGDFTGALELLEESARRFRELGDEHATLSANRVLGLAHYELGDMPRARALHEENLVRARATGNERMEAASLAALATIDAPDVCRLRDVLEMLGESTRIFREHDLYFEVAVNLSRFAFALAHAGRSEAAARLLESSIARHEEIGATTAAWVERMNEETKAMIAAKLDDQALVEASTNARTLTVDDSVALALSSMD